jgi:hypothetical protein
MAWVQTGCYCNCAVVSNSHHLVDVAVLCTSRTCRGVSFVDWIGLAGLDIRLFGKGVGSEIRTDGTVGVCILY